MRTFIQAFAALALLAAPLASAQPEQLCRDNLTQDRQPDFSEGSLERANNTIDITTETPPRLQLNTNLTALNTERITFPFDQRVTISYVYESAGASHALGYMYLDDLQKRPGDPATKVEYVNAAGNLVDNNNNGIFDLHEDLYNLAPTTGPKARDYVGGTRRCPVRPFTDHAGETYSEPDIARRGCGSTFQRIRTNHNPEEDRIADARPGQTFNLIDADVVGRLLNSDGQGNATSSQFSDGGLFPHIPNLLEPPANANGNKGIGKMVFLVADDDGDEGDGATYGNLAPVVDDDLVDDGVPDYDVSAYDARGLPRASNPDDGISTFDRTVDMGMVEGGKELIFFLIVFYDSNHRPNEDTVFPCLKQDAFGKCLLHLRTPINVFFSKSAWNMDQNSKADAVVAERNIGCSYNSSCRAGNMLNNNSCRLGPTGTGPRMCGWLDGPKTTAGTTLHRLLNDTAYGNLDMPMERVTVPRPAGIRNPMPHVIVGAPTTDPFRWILGFEDLPGGGDRDFNDVVFVINKENGGNMRSATVSGDISPSIADDFVITKVRFKRQDDIAPAPRTCAGGPPCWTEVPVGSGACTPANGVRPTIRYSLAVDCRVCSGGTCTANPTPTWFPVEFPNTTPPTQQVEVDVLSMGFTGSQLCWKVDISSPNERCKPIVDNIDVGYQAVRAGSYARASPSTLGNAIIWGVNETPGSAWGDDWPDTGLPAASTRLYDARKDFTVRGRLYFRSLYDPEKPDETRAIERWDAGRVMAMALRGGADPLSRNLITSSSAGELTTVSAEMADDNENSPLFPDSLCDEYANGRYTYDLNNDGKCGTPSIDADDKRVEGPTNDRNFLREWLHGWEDRHAPGASDVRRPWPMGGINLSTAAVAVPPYLDTWALNASPKERDDYRENFMKPLQERDTVAYVGTMNGFLHAFDAGAFRNATQDACATGPQLRGYFQTTGSCSTTPGTDRDYGSGQETFAYLPRTLLERYRNLYVQFPGSGTLPKPQADASATIANVDFGLEDGGTRKHEWKLSPTLSKADGAKTVLVSATGKNSPAVYALDITRPGTAGYPLPLWEFNLRDAAIDGAFTAARGADPTVNHPDNSGSRHAPSVARLAWGSHTTSAWTAVVGTDYSPSPTTRAGAVYLIDMKTGRPLNYGTEPEGELAGIITLEQGVGVAAESALVDLNRDGNYDVMYVPVTSGGVYRINLDKVDTDAPLGRKVKTCKVASAPAELSNHADAATGQDPSFQQLYSNLAVKVVRDNTTPTVRFYFGTGDNPDEFSDGPPNKDTFRYHLLAFEDTDPAGTGDCELMEPLWVRQLDPGQTVWGGVALSSEQVYATTAVGRAADICGLSQDESGRYYATGQLPTESGAAPPVSSASLDGHGINAPVVHDQHVFVLTATGKMKVIGDENWNNGAVAPGAARSRVLIYDAIPDGRMPQ